MTFHVLATRAMSVRLRRESLMNSVCVCAHVMSGIRLMLFKQLHFTLTATAIFITCRFIKMFNILILDISCIT